MRLRWSCPKRLRLTQYTIQMLYEIWQARNAASRGEDMQNPKEIVRKVHQLAEEWASLKSENKPKRASLRGEDGVFRCRIEL